MTTGLVPWSLTDERLLEIAKRREFQEPSKSKVIPVVAGCATPAFFFNIAIPPTTPLQAILMGFAGGYAAPASAWLTSRPAAAETLTAALWSAWAEKPHSTH